MLISTALLGDRYHDPHFPSEETGKATFFGDILQCHTHQHTIGDLNQGSLEPTYILSTTILPLS